MVSKEENDLLTQVGPGTPLGEALRRYWIPFLLPDEVGEPDGDPVRVRLLGENLVAFRDTEGRIGLLDEFCAHRGASLFYGRNERSGLCCIYHGWKYDSAGTVLETPNEPLPRVYEGKLKLRAYPTREAGGAVWAYLGPPAHMPPFPAFPWNTRRHVRAKKVWLDCNYLQSIEGGVDSSHVSILHRASVAVSQGQLVTRDSAPRIDMQDMPYGFRYAALREADDGQVYVRITPFMMPWYTIVPIPSDLTQAAHAWVPIDDERNWVFTFNWNADDSPLPSQESTHEYEMADRFRKRRTRANNHLQERDSMRAGHWSGIPLIPDQDATVQESMEPVFDRSREHLGRADLAIVRMRSLLLGAIQAVKRGSDPLGVAGGESYERIRSEAMVVPAGTEWTELGLTPQSATIGS